MPTKPNTPDPSRNPLVLIGLATVAVLLIVIGPFLMVRDATRQSLAAAAMVNHTYEVGSTINALMYDLRNRESAAVAYAHNHDSQAVRDRLADSARGIPPNLARLEELTQDNPEQLIRVGKLTSLIEQRGATMDAILNKPAGEADVQEVQWLIDRNPLRFISN